MERSERVPRAMKERHPSSGPASSQLVFPMSKPEVELLKSEPKKDEVERSSSFLLSRRALPTSTMAALASCVPRARLRSIQPATLTLDWLSFRLLPTPRFSAPAAHHSDDEDEGSSSTPAAPSTALATVVRPYGGRRGWRPSKAEEFGDGGAYPECSLAQYPLDMGRKKVRADLPRLPRLPRARTSLPALPAGPRSGIRVATDRCPCSCCPC